MSEYKTDTLQVGEHEVYQTENGHSIEKPREKLTAEELKEALDTYGLGGETPEERLQSLRGASKEVLAVFIADLNARLQGSESTLVSDNVIKVGDKSTIAPEHRYDLFTSIVSKIQNAREDINPARVGDVLALATVLLHPFEDGNGRTARIMGLVYRPGFDSTEFKEDFDQLAEPRDRSRARGGFVISGYIPYVGDGVDQSDPAQVEAYVDRLLNEDVPNLYVGPYGQAELVKSEDQ